MVEKKDIQKRLCVAIKSSKLSQKVLAEKLGISSSTIRNTFTIMYYRHLTPLLIYAIF